MKRLFVLLAMLAAGGAANAATYNCGVLRPPDGVQNQGAPAYSLVTTANTVTVIVHQNDTDPPKTTKVKLKLTLKGADYTRWEGLGFTANFISGSASLALGNTSASCSLASK